MPLTIENVNVNNHSHSAVSTCIRSNPESDLKIKEDGNVLLSTGSYSNYKLLLKYVYRFLDSVTMLTGRKRRARVDLADICEQFPDHVSVWLACQGKYDEKKRPIDENLIAIMETAIRCLSIALHTEPVIAMSDILSIEGDPFVVWPFTWMLMCGFSRIYCVDSREKLLTMNIKNRKNCSVN